MKFGQWNFIAEGSASSGLTSIMPVHGGYFVRTANQRSVFFPDPEHKTWEVTE